MELRTEFLEHSLRQAAELAGKAASSDDLQHALEICRKSMEYYRWYKIRCRPRPATALQSS